MNLIVDLNRKGSLASTEYVYPVAGVAKDFEGVTVRHYMGLDDAAIQNAKHIILSGTPIKDDEYLNNIDAFDWILETDTPVLGICAGMQAMSKTYGAQIIEFKEIGMIEVETVKDNPLTEGRFKAYALHKNTLQPSDNLEVLARSKNCVQAVKTKNKPHYGILFHPEVRNQHIIQAFLKI